MSRKSRAGIVDGHGERVVGAFSSVDHFDSGPGSVGLIGGAIAIVEQRGEERRGRGYGAAALRQC